MTCILCWVFLLFLAHMSSPVTHTTLKYFRWKSLKFLTQQNSKTLNHHRSVQSIILSICLRFENQYWKSDSRGTILFLPQSMSAAWVVNVQQLVGCRQCSPHMNLQWSQLLGCCDIPMSSTWCRCVTVASRISTSLVAQLGQAAYDQASEEVLYEHQDSLHDGRTDLQMNKINYGIKCAVNVKD